VRVSPAWLRAGGAAAVGAVVIACTTNAAAGGAPAPHQSHQPAVTAGEQPGSSAGAGSGGSGPAGTGSGGSGSAGSGSGGSGSGASGAAPGAGTAEAAQAASLSARQLAGQRVIFSYAGLTPPAALLWLISHGEAAGVIFFTSNISSRAQIAAVINKLEAAAAAATNPVHSPLLLMTDQEGGLVRRLPGAPVLSEKQIGESAHPAAAATTAGTGAAANLHGVGMNVNLSPVLDVYRTAGDFDDQFQRSYSMSASKVSSLGADFIKAQQKGGVAATAKHFPGLGAAAKTQNTDVGPVTLNVSAANLRGIDELPYKAAIAAKVKLVMVSWAVYPGVGATRPGGLSTNVVQGELRKRLGFTGVTITDALEAGALRAFGSVQHRALLAAQAGMDLLLCSGQTKGEGTACVDGLESGYNDGALGKTAFKAAATRVLSLRTGLPR
jgi:beta-N-acetylhexosaminidase